MTVSGLVQGVGFRYYVQRNANSNRVTGYVKNLSNGSVEAVFEGESSRVNILVEYTKKGPFGAHVSSFRIIEEPFKDEFESFEVRR